jgi:uncharacterized membrane protein
MQQLSIHDRLAQLEFRLSNLEHWLKVPWLMPDPVPPPMRAATTVEPVPVMAIPLSAEPPPIPAQPSMDTALPRVETVPPATTDAPAIVPPTLPPPFIEYRTAPKAPNTAAAKSPKSNSVENLIGLKWSAWIGAIVLLIGAALGVKYVYDQNWFAVVPSWVWLALIAFTGIAFIAAGEWVFRHVHKLTAASLYAVGVAVLFLAGFTGHAYYKLYDPSVANVLMILAALVGAAIARRGNMVSIGVLSILGANLVPLLVHTDHPNLTGFLIYLGLLELVALVLAFWPAEAKWWVLRGLSWTTTALWMAIISQTDAFGHPASTVILWSSAGYALGFQAELIASALRQPALLKIKSMNSGAAFSLLVTACFTVLTLLTIPAEQRWDRVETIGVELAVCTALAIFLRRGNAREIAYGFALQAIALLVLEVPIALSGPSIIIAWMLMAVAGATMARKLNLAHLRQMSIAIWMLALGQWVYEYVDSGNSASQVISLNLLNTPITQSLILAWALSLAGQTIAALNLPRNIASSDTRMAMQRLVQFVALAVWIFASIVGLPPVGATVSLIVLAWILALADSFCSLAKFAAQSIFVLAVAAMKWLIVDSLGRRLSPEWTNIEHHPFANSMFGVGLLLAVSLVGIYLLRRRVIHQAFCSNQNTAAATMGFNIALAAIAIVTAAFSIQIDILVQSAAHAGNPMVWPVMQLEQFAFTALWSLAAAFAWAAAMWADIHDPKSQRAAALRRVGFLLLAKYMVADSLPWFGSNVAAMPVLNAYTLAGVAVAVLLTGTSSLRMLAEPWRVRFRTPTPSGLTAGLFTILWAGTFEIIRIVSQGTLPNAAAWPEGQLSLILLTAWWTGLATILFVSVPMLDADPGISLPYRKFSAAFILLLGCKFLLIDTLFFRAQFDPANALPIFNPMGLAGAILGCAFSLIWWQSSKPPLPRHYRPAAIGLLLLVSLWIGSLEIDRCFHWWIPARLISNPQLAANAPLSIFWSIFAAACVTSGFRYRSAPMRYFGLSLIAVTLIKVVLVDTQSFGTGYRILAYLALGVILIGISAIYGKMSMKNPT